MSPEAKVELVFLIISLIEKALKQVADDPDLMEGVLNKSKSVDDWLQEKFGNVNQPTTEESIQLAIETSIVRDKETICSIIAVITTLYATMNVVRGSIVGGTLLKEFGQEFFPHIDRRELRYAKPINIKLKRYFETSIFNSFDETISKFDFEKHADFSNLNGQSGYGAWTSVSYISVYSFTKMLLNFGPKALKVVKSLLRRTNNN